MTTDNRTWVQAKKAQAELEPTKGMTMRSDAIGAMSYALDEIQEYLDGGGIDHLQQARDYLAANIGGTRGGSIDATGHFRRAIEELEQVEGVDPDDE